MSKQIVRIWDKIQVLLTWGLALTLFLSVLSLNLIESMPVLHTLAVSLLGIAVVCRAVWGIYGSNASLFQSMLYSPTAVVLHLYDALSFRKESWQGHSPLGGLVAFSALILMGLASITGLMIVTNNSDGSWVAQTLGFTIGDNPLASHTTLTYSASFLWICYSIGVLVRLINRKTSLKNFLLSGREVVYLQSNEPIVSLKPKSTTAGLSTSALAICLAIVLILPIFSNTTFNQTVQETPSVVAEQTTEPTVSDLSQIETAAGENETLEDLANDNKIYQQWEESLSIPLPIATE